MKHYRTLQESFEDGNLPRLPWVTLYAQVACAADTPGDVRRAAMAILSRARQYLVHVDFCTSTLATGRFKSEQPRALNASRDEHVTRGALSPLCVTSHPDMPRRIWREAHAMCLTTAICVAHWELAEALPDCADLLDRARIAVLAACKNEALTGSAWFAVSRHLKTPSARRYLDRLIELLPSCWLIFHPDTGMPVFVSASDPQQTRTRYESVAREANRPLVVSAPAERTYTAARLVGGRA